MKTTLEQLNELLAKEQYKALTLEQARENAWDKNWSAMIDSMMEEGVKTTIFEACQWTALLFDTYGETIKSVKLSFDVEYNKQDSYMTSTLLINGQLCDDTDLDLAEEDQQACVEVDNMEALRYAVDELCELRDSNLVARVGHINEVFEGEITSAAQAREIANKHAGQYQMFFRREMLEEVAGKALAEKPDTPRRVPKV